MTYNTTQFVLEGLVPETSEWKELYPDTELDLDEVLVRYGQMKQLCRGLKIRCRRIDSVHTITTTSAPIDLEEVILHRLG